MTIKLNKEESEKFFYNALCNGLAEMHYYGLELCVNKGDYNKAKITLKEKGNDSICYEDVLMEILRNGGKLNMIDNEGEGENDKSVSIKDVHRNMNKVPLNAIMQMINEEDDATTADIIIQTIFYKEIIFG